MALPSAPKAETPDFQGTYRGWARGWPSFVVPKTPEEPAGGGQDAGYGFYSLGFALVPQAQ